MAVMIGVDLHKGSDTAVAVDATGRGLASRVSGGDRSSSTGFVHGRRRSRGARGRSRTPPGSVPCWPSSRSGERGVDVQPKLAAHGAVLATEASDTLYAAMVAICRSPSAAMTQKRTREANRGTALTPARPAHTPRHRLFGQATPALTRAKRYDRPPQHPTHLSPTKRHHSWTLA